MIDTVICLYKSFNIYFIFIYLVSSVDLHIYYLFEWSYIMYFKKLYINYVICIIYHLIYIYTRLITSYQIFRKTNPKIIVFYVETVKFIDHKLKNLHTKT
jgi:hypothetical protein